MLRSPRSVSTVVVVLIIIVASAATHARANEIWVAPTSQQDVGGLLIASSGLWPVTAIGAVRIAWAIPDDLQSFQSAKVAIIPHSPGGAANLNVFICAAQSGDSTIGSCAGPVAVPFTGVSNQLVEVDISAVVGPKVGVAGANYLTVLAFTTPTTGTDHIAGLRFTYAPGGAVPAGMVAFFAGTACPGSWTEYAAARGRVVVGLPTGGTGEGTFGSALGNLTARTIADVPSHIHSINPPASVTNNAGAHVHTVSAGTGVGLNDFGLTAGFTAIQDNQTAASGGAHSHALDIGPFDSMPAGSPFVDVSMPYVQLIACRKS